MKDGLFHRDIGLPDCTAITRGVFHLWFSRHAANACISDRYGIIRPPHFIAVTKEQIIEVEMSNSRIVKAVVRLPYSERFDLVLVLIPDTKTDTLVKTCWLNRKTDTHRTLDRSKYQTYVVS